jgi:hypothetical protein
MARSKRFSKIIQLQITPEMFEEIQKRLSQNEENLGVNHWLRGLIRKELKNAN